MLESPLNEVCRPSDLQLLKRIPDIFLRNLRIFLFWRTSANDCLRKCPLTLYLKAFSLKTTESPANDPLIHNLSVWINLNFYIAIWCVKFIFLSCVLELEYRFGFIFTKLMISLFSAHHSKIYKIFVSLIFSFSDTYILKNQTYAARIKNLDQQPGNPRIIPR